MLGVDFGGPQRARDQRRKIVAIAAIPTGWRRYRIDAVGLNARLLASRAPGWTAKELVDELIARPVRIVAFDFPFSIPDALLRDEAFAALVGHRGAFMGWRAFSWFVASKLPLQDPLAFQPFDAWRSQSPGDRKRFSVKRVTDVIAGGQPPLKDKFQLVFQMTLLGNALLSRLWESHRYRVLPFAGGRGAGEIIEVFPGATLRCLGLKQYKSRPSEAIQIVIDACATAGIELEVDARLQAACCTYSSGGRSPDHDIADAFVALCTGILHAEGASRMAFDGEPSWRREHEGAIWVPRI